MLTNSYGSYDDEISNKQFYDRDRCCYGIYHREGYNDEQISHFPDWHGVGAVAHDAKYAEQSDADTNTCLCLQVFQHKYHEEHEEEYCHRYQHEGEIEITPAALLVIQTVYDNKVYDYTDKKSYQHGSKIRREG